MSNFWNVAGWPLSICAAGALVYVVVLKPKLDELHKVVDKDSQFAAASSAWQKFVIWFDGKKTLAVQFLIGTVAAIWAWIEGLINNLDQSTVDMLKGLPFANLVGDLTAAKIISILSIVGAVTTIIGKVKAAKTTPKA